MNILLVSNLYPPIVFGGYEILAAQVADRLRSRGHDVVVLTSAFRADEAPTDPKVIRSLEMTTSFPKPGESVGQVDFRLRTLDRVARVNERITRDVIAESGTLFDDGRGAEVVFCWSLNRITLGPVVAAQASGVPVCQTMNDAHPGQFRLTHDVSTPRLAARRLLESTLARHATLRHVAPFPVAVISEALRGQLAEAGVPVEHARVIHQGVPVESLPFVPLKRAPDETLRILYVGQLSRVKGVHTILHALVRLATVRSFDFRLTIVGEGVPEYEVELRRIALEGGIADRVTFAGRAPRESIPGYLHSHHVLVFSSEWEEPFGLAHLEAMASGCAVISTTTGGSRELIRHGENALAYEAGNAADLAKMLQVVTGENCRARLVRGGRFCVTSQFSLDRYVTDLEHFLAGTARRHRTLTRLPA